MLLVASAIALFSVFVAISLKIQLSMMRLRAAYWEGQVKQDSMIRHQWLQESQPSWKTFGKQIYSAKSPLEQ